MKRKTIKGSGQRTPRLRMKQGGGPDIVAYAEGGKELRRREKKNKFSVFLVFLRVFGDRKKSSQEKSLQTYQEVGKSTKEEKGAPSRGLFNCLQAKKGEKGW